MSHAGRIVVTTGPERGKVFELEEELVHIGRAPENQVVLEDPALEDHQATILHKNGRFAIYRPTEADVEVDGSDIPIGRWVWLPIEARLQFGRRTSCQFSYAVPGETIRSESTEGDPANKVPVPFEGGESDADRQSSEPPRRHSVKALPIPPAEDNAAAEAAALADSRNGRSRGRTSEKRSSEKKKKKKRKKQVARFITDQGGPMVELGTDGNLPELALQDGPSRKLKRSKPKSSSPALLYGVLGLSMLASLGMLLVDASPTTVTEISKVEARRELVRFFGMPEDVIEQWERELKQDRQRRWMWTSPEKPVTLMGRDNEPAPWQKALRVARIARSRGDLDAEYAAYRQVLDQLNAEDRDLHFGLTGHAKGDAELKRLISIAISR
ncbi:MAG: FHA domain-containing protein [Planctomycetaceae bacterium]